jgi:hypothetical protein
MEIFLEDHQTFSYLGSIYQLDQVSKYAKKKYQNTQTWDRFLALLPLVGKIQGCATKMRKHIEPSKHPIWLQQPAEEYAKVSTNAMGALENYHESFQCFI